MGKVHSVNTANSNPPKRLALFGATGFTGRVVLDELASRGIHVRALVRRPESIPKDSQSPTLKLIQGNALEPDDVAHCLQGTDAVIHCLGVGGKGNGKPTTLVSKSVELLIGQMDRAGPKRIVCMSNVGANGSGKWLVNRLVIPIFFRWLLPIIEDKERMESLLEASAVEWSAVRFPNIVDGKSAPVRVSDDGRDISMNITTGSVATYLVDQALAPALRPGTPSVSN